MDATLDLLLELQQIPGPSGDEGLIADFVEARCGRIAGVTTCRLGDLVLALRGKPQVAIFAHLDTIGFTLGYDRSLIPIGGPKITGDEKLRECGGPGHGRVRLKQKGGETERRLSGRDGLPGSRWIYAQPLKIKRDRKLGDVVSGPYLDNRAGVWNALQTLARCDDVLVAFTTGEEHSGGGAHVAARVAYQEHGITRAIISDITWHTEHVKMGLGPAISLRDRFVPRQRFLNEVVALAEESGLAWQREVESDGGSDGAVIERSAYPIDWVFIGAPEKDPHTPDEQCAASDLLGTVDLYAHLVPGLSR